MKKQKHIRSLEELEKINEELKKQGDDIIAWLRDNGVLKKEEIK